jgi:hypothetical protein
MANGFKSGVKDSGSVAELKGKGGAKKVDRNESSHDVEFAKGGDTPMFGEQAAGEQKPGGTAHTETSAPGADFATGGKGKMFGFRPSAPAMDGVTAPRG